MFVDSITVPFASGSDKIAEGEEIGATSKSVDLLSDDVIYLKRTTCQLHIQCKCPFSDPLQYQTQHMCQACILHSSSGQHAMHTNLCVKES
jgi:hypothetical protein